MNAATANSTSTATLVLRTQDGQEYPLIGVCLIGRETECEICLDVPQVSRYHAKLTPHDARSVLVEDLHSTNGTFINGHRLSAPQVLSIGDELRLDQLSFRLATASSGRAQATVFTSVEAVRAALNANQPTPLPFAPPVPAPAVASPAPASAAEPASPPPASPAAPTVDPASLSLPAEAEAAPAGAPAPAAPAEPGREHTSMLGPDERQRLAQLAHQGVRQQRSGGPRLIILSAPARGQVIPLQRGSSGSWVIGRATDADITLTDRTISAHHARLEKNGVNWRVENLKATNGLFINGELVSDGELKSGDRIRLGGTELEFRTDQGSPTAEVKPATVRKRSRDTTLWLGVGAAVFIGITLLALLLGS